jgi:NAD(P)-dependent dehydrogenase (short-subunit alcohol dehydrogenase family)
MGTGRLALVTAAAGAGLGQAVARRLAARGDRVVVTDIHARRTQDVALAIARDNPGTTVVGYPLDVGDRGRIDSVVDEVVAALGPVHILVNNAAVDIPGTIFEYETVDWDRTLAVNLTGPWYLCRRLLPLMRDAGGGVVVNIGSLASGIGGAGVESPYAVSKGALHALTLALARDAGQFGIRAVTLSPGVISDSRFVKEHPETLDLPDVQPLLGSFPTAAELADAVAFLTSDSARHITGTALHVNGGAYLNT